MSNPASVSSLRQYLAFHSSLSRRSVVAVIRSITLIAPATMTGATVLENRYGRARWRHISTSSRRPLTQPPDAPPSALPSVVVMTSILPDDAAVLVRPAPGLADEAGGVRVVHEHHGVVLLGQRDDLVQLGEVAVHGEHAVGDDHAEALVLVLLQLLLQVPHVGVLVGVLHRLAQPHAVHDGGVDQPVGDHHVLVVQAGLEHAGVGVHAGGEEQRVLGAEELRQLVLEFAVDVLGAADEAHRRHPVAAAVQPGVRRRDHVGMAGQPEVVVGADVDALFDFRADRKLHLDLRPLRRMDVALFLEQTGGLDCLRSRSGSDCEMLSM